MRSKRLIRFKIQNSKFKKICFLTAICLVFSCATFVSNTYKSLYIAGTSYDFAMKSISRLESEGFINQEQRELINQYANYFYVAYHSAVDAFEVYNKTKSSADKDKLIVALTEMSLKWNKLADYVNRIAPGTLKPNLEVFNE